MWPLTRQRMNEVFPDNSKQTDLEAVGNNPPWGKKYQEYKRPLIDVSGLECLVNGRGNYLAAVPGCAAGFMLLLLQKKVWVQVS